MVYSGEPIPHIIRRVAVLLPHQPLGKQDVGEDGLQEARGIPRGIVRFMMGGTKDDT